MMGVASLAPPSLVDRLSPRLLLLWAGVSAGVAFVATPAKFMAPSLSLPVALDVGRHTFRVYNDVELALLAALIVLGAWSKARRSRYLALVVPAAAVAAQALWLIPALDARVSVIAAGGQPPPSNLHAVYIGAELLKLVWLLSFGLADLRTRRRY
jgi:hypothetical protein